MKAVTLWTGVQFRLILPRMPPLGIDFRAGDGEDILPFEDAAFDMVINRHGDFNVKDIHCMLKDSGIFIEEPEQMIDIYHYSMEYCLAHSGESVNERYRQDRQDEIELKISEMVAQHTTDTDLVLYRGVCDYVYDLMKENAKDIPNCDLYEKGFLATSLVKGQELNYKIKLRIYVPAGSKCVYQGNVNNEQDFYEVDIMRGSRLKIESVDSEYINCKLLGTA